MQLSPFFLRKENFGIVLLHPDFYRMGVIDPLSAMILILSKRLPSIHEVKKYLALRLNLDEKECNDVLNDVQNKFKLIFKPVGTYTRDLDIGLKEDDVLYFDVNEKEHLVARQGFVRLKTPIAISFCITFRCHLKCRYCYAPTNSLPPLKIGRELSYEEIIHMIDDARELDVKQIVITGGEPFLRDDLIDIIKYIARKGIFVECSTKYPLKDEVFHELHGSLDKIQISIDAFYPKTQDFLTQSKGSLHWLLTNVECAIKHKIRTQVNSVITGYNISEIPLLVKSLLEKGVDFISLSYYGRAHKHFDDVLFPNLTDYIALKRKLYEILKENRSDELEEGVFMISNASKESLLLLKPINYAIEALQGIIRVESGFRCGGFRNALSILPDGKVIFCDRIVWAGSEFVVGDLRSNRLIDIWNSPRVWELCFPSREKFIGTMCYKCERFDECQKIGFCYVSSYEAYGRYFAPRPGCPFSKPQVRVL